jgi:hypothetical protein
MLIIGGRDYYDSIKSFGVDKTVVYNRKEERIKFKKGPSMYADGLFDQKYFRGTRIIGFCGKLYPLLQTRKFIIYDKKMALKSVKNSGKISWNNRDLVACFNEYLNNPELLKIFVDKNTPAFIYGDYLDGKYEGGKDKELIINPRLKNWKFQSVKDPVTAFQEIYMFLSGVLGTPEKPMIKISDKEMAKKRGHDSPFSFRKPKGKRGNPKWR